MIGKGITKLIGYAIAGAIALVIGTEILNSVVTIVVSFRQGDISSLAIVVLVTIGLLFLVNRMSEESPLKLVLNILSYAASAYLFVIVFVIALPYGLLVSGIASILTAVLCSSIKDPQIITGYFHNVNSQLQSTPTLHGLKSRIIPIGDDEHFSLNTYHEILILEEGSRDRIIQLMKDRPLLPISLTHFEDCDVLFITEAIDSAKSTQIMKLLEDIGLQPPRHASKLLAEAIQMIPIIDAQNGLSMKNYRIARDEASIKELLSLSPIRMTIFPSTSGLKVLVPDMDAPGLIVEPLDVGKEATILLQRDFSIIKEVEKPVETAA